MSELVKECHHGRLTRQCRECDMEKEIGELQDQLTTITKQRDELVVAVEELITCEESEVEDRMMTVMDLLSTIKEQKDA